VRMGGEGRGGGGGVVYYISFFYSICSAYVAS